MTKTKHILFCVLIFGIFVTALVLGGRLLVEASWERTLEGPFYGEPFSGEPKAPVSSKLLIPGGGYVLSVYESKELKKPLLALHSHDGKVVWVRLLAATNEVKRLENVQLMSIKKTSTGYKVRMICDWDMGREGGLIYLHPDFSFNSFALSW